MDYNGFMVSKSEPKKALKTVKKTLLIDSADRDTTKYYTNGDFVVYLPRVYENVVSMRLVAAEFPPVYKVTSGAVTHVYSDSSNTTTGFKATNDAAVAINTAYYFLVDIEGMNKSDECAVGSSKSSFPDGFFAKIPALANSYGGQTFIEYNDHSAEDNIARYSPAIGKIDRLHIRTRLHNQKDTNIGFLYWTTDGAIASGSNQKGAEFNLTLELEMLDNVFDDFSSLETHLRDRS
jgi:hypothetical protein